MRVSADTAPPGTVPVPKSRLEPDAIGVAQDTVIGMASAAPGVSVGLTLAGLAAATAYSGGLTVIEYAILIGFAAAGLVLVLHHAPGTFPITSGWWRLSGITGHGSLPAGLLIAVYIYSGWDGTLYVNEEVKHRRENPGRTAMLAVVLLTLLYVLVITRLQGAVRPGLLQAQPLINSLDELARLTTEAIAVHEPVQPDEYLVKEWLII